jgi:cell division cycle 2-like
VGPKKVIKAEFKLPSPLCAAMKKRSPSRAEGEPPAARRHSGPYLPSASSRPSSATAAARNSGIPMGSLTSYTLHKTVGRGAFGVVRRASHHSSGETVAIKSPRNDVGHDELLREASLLLSAGHDNPGVVKLLEVARGPTNNADDVHLVMEFVEPKDLHDVLLERRRRRLPFTEVEAHGLMRQLLDGAERMHASGVVHCDLKPGNVLVDRSDGRLKICDFGLAVSNTLPPPAGVGLQRTPRYMAPELLVGGTDDHVPAMDMWSLGCVMAEIMAGRPLFHVEENEVMLGMQIIRFLGIPDDVSELPLHVTAPSKLRNIVPEERRSQAGFDVLHGLLEYHPKDRLTAAAALQMPWFSQESAEPPSPSKDVN